MSVARNSSHRRTITGLLKVARLSDEAALAQLLSHHTTYLRWIAKTCLDSRIRQRVSESDIVQETFTKAVKHFDDFEGDSPGEFEAWLRKILIRCAGREVERHLRRFCVTLRVATRYSILVLKTGSLREIDRICVTFFFKFDLST